MSNNDAPAPNNDTTETASFPLESRIREKLHKLPPLSPSCFIYRVPERIRSSNPSFYTPKLVSIGPLHHGKDSLQDMEEHKYRYLQHFLDRTEENLEYYIQKIRCQEEKLRSYYADTIKYSSHDFVTIILVDSAFIIQLFLNHYFRTVNIADRIIRAPKLIADIRPDLLLLENQLPFFILEDLFDPEIVHRNPYSVENGNPSFIQLYLDFFGIELDMIGVDCNLLTVNSSQARGEHFVDIIRNLCLPLEPFIIGTREASTPTAPSITELHQAGVKFKVQSTKNLFGIQFHNGILHIPKLQVSLRMGATLRSMAVFEQCHYYNRRIADYLDLMNCFVKTPKDVELLAKYGIVTNMRGDNSEACSLIKNISKGCNWNCLNFCFSPLYEDLHNHCKRPWNKWMANLRQNYLGTPWKIASVVAAAFLIILTTIQTVCSLISLSVNSQQ